MKTATKKCKICGKPFEGKKGQRYCSIRCRPSFNKRKVLPIKKERDFSTKEGETICWVCKNATGGCSWSARLEPVKGWKAKEAPIRLTRKGYTKYTDSYVVLECPEYVRG
jgi:hypothetical protein